MDLLLVCFVGGEGWTSGASIQDLPGSGVLWLPFCNVCVLVLVVGDTGGLGSCYLVVLVCGVANFLFGSLFVPE